MVATMKVLPDRIGRAIEARAEAWSGNIDLMAQGVVSNPEANPLQNMTMKMEFRRGQTDCLWNIDCLPPKYSILRMLRNGYSFTADAPTTQPPCANVASPICIYERFVGKC